LESGERIQDEVKRLVESIWRNQTFDGTLGMSGLLFGHSKDDLIDTFSKVTLETMLGRAASSIPVPSIQLSVNNMDLDVFDAKTLSTNFDFAYSGLQGDIMINLPYIFFKVRISDNDFMDISVNDFVLANRKLKGLALIFWPENRDAGNKLVNIVANVLFHREYRVQDSFAIGNLQFGSGKGSEIQTFSKLFFADQVDPYSLRLKKYFDDNQPLELKDVNAKLVHGGLDVNCVTSNPPFPVDIKVKTVEVTIAYELNGRIFKPIAITLQNIGLPFFKVRGVPNLDVETGFQQPLNDLVLRMFQFIDFAANARLGFITLIGSQGTRFGVFDQTLFVSQTLIATPPLVIDVVPIWPKIREGIVLPIRIELGIRNPSPVHIDLGQVEILLKDSSGKKVLDIDSERDIVARNVNEGGNSARIPNIGSLLITIPFRTLNPFTIANLIKDLLSGEGIDLQIRLKRDGKEMDWVSTVCDYLVENGIVRQFIPLLGVILSNIKLEFFGLDVLQLPIIRDIVNQSRRWLSQHNVQHLQINAH
jgi:hypothetical protein